MGDYPMAGIMVRMVGVARIPLFRFLLIFALVAQLLVLVVPLCTRSFIDELEIFWNGSWGNEIMEVGENGGYQDIGLMDMHCTKRCC
jgi:hypothetical protein